MSIKEVVIVVSVSVDVSDDYTKVSVIAVSSVPVIKFEKFNVVFETKSIKDIGPVHWSEEFQLRDDRFNELGYRFLNSRELTVNLLSDYLKLKVFGEVEKAVNDGVLASGEYFVKYQLLTDYSQGPKKFSDSICMIADALSVDTYRAWIINSLGPPIVLDDIPFDRYLQDPISHSKRMYLHYLAL